MSGRLEEMPGEEGYPAYLASRLAQFYERAGRTISLGQEGRSGALSAIGAVSPPGGDISEPVSQATLRIVKVFWSLDANLAHARHFPAINWLNSYSLYVDRLAPWFAENVDKEFPEMRATAIRLLQEEAELEEVVQLVGVDALSFEDRIKLEACKSIREDYLHQNAFHDIDTYASMKKQYLQLKLILTFYELSRDAITKGAALNKLASMKVREDIGRFKYVEESVIDQAYKDIDSALRSEINELIAQEDEDE
jgi:V/A-type H+-transporting ATPase subunit A